MGMDGFTIISSCFCVLTVAVTFALMIQIYYGSPQIQPHGAVATDDQVCSEIGVNVLKEGGNSVDTAIASLLCLCVTHPHLIGPGGGGLMLIHDHKLNQTKIFDFMTALPSGLLHPSKQFDLHDGNSIGVPGFLKGIEKVHEIYGTTSWKTLFEPSITLARRGFSLSKHLTEELHRLNEIKYSQNFKDDFFMNQGVFPTSGTVIKRNKFADFLEKISIGGSEEFYLLTYGAEVIDAMKKAGSNVSVHDFHNYEVKERPLIHKNVQNKTVVTAGPPFGGAQVLAGLSLLQKSEVSPSTPLNDLYGDFSQALLYSASTISDIFNSGLNEANVSSQSFVDDFEFSANSHYEAVGSVVPEFPAIQVSVIDTQDLYVSVVAGLGTTFGSGVMTEHDIVLNNHLAHLPVHEHSEEEAPSEFERPYSSYAPLIIMDNNDICAKRVVLSGSSSAAVLQVASQVLFRNLDIAPAIIEPRLTLGPKPSVLLIDDFDTEGKKLDSEVRQFLKSKNFELLGLFEPLGVNGVLKFGDTVSSHSDTRTGGYSSRVDRNKEV